MSNRTLADIALAKVYFEILVNFAKSNRGQTIQYGQLVAMAKELYPQNTFVVGAIPTNIGRRLDALREFTAEHKVPDLSALVVNRVTGENGVGFNRSFDGEVVRQQIADFDWLKLQLTFDQFIELEMQAVEQRELKARRVKRIKEDAAREIFYNFFTANKNNLPTLTQGQKEKIIKLLMSGLDPRDAFSEVI